MLVSAAIPAWNSAEYLREAIESVLAQTYQPIEIIVVDDGSTDHTREVCQSFGPLVRYLYQANDGTKGAGARARAVLEARGDLIAFLDQDDRWLPPKIEKQLQALSSSPFAGAVFTGVRPVDKYGNVLDMSLYQGVSGNVFHRLLSGNCFYNSSAIVPRHVIARCGLPDTESGVADWELWLRISRYYPLLFIDDRLTEYRVHDEGYSADKRRLIQASHQVLERQVNRLHPKCRECKRAFRAGRDFISNAYYAQYCLTARSGQFFESLPLLWKAIELSPRHVLRPKRLLSALKNCALASTGGS